MTAAPTGDADRALNGLDHLPTEASRPELAELDTWSAADAVRLFIDDHADVLAALRAAAGQIAAAVEAVAGHLSAGGRLIYVGAGTGGRIAAQDAAEIGPSFGLRGRVAAVFAGGVDAIVDGREFYEDDAEQGSIEVQALAPRPHDVVVGVSASGRTPYVLGGLAAARAAGAFTIGFACVPRSPLAAAADAAIEVVTGPEIIAGSTRLKAGSAQKLVLNTLSTMAMVHLGRTYGNLMVDVVADNGKLRRRALRAVVEATRVDESRAEQALDAADGHAKVAIVAILTGTTSARARELLSRADGRVRIAVALARDAD